MSIVWFETGITIRFLVIHNRVTTLFLSRDLAQTCHTALRMHHVYAFQLMCYFVNCKTRCIICPKHQVMAVTLMWHTAMIAQHITFPFPTCHIVIFTLTWLMRRSPNAPCCVMCASHFAVSCGIFEVLWDFPNC